MNQVPYPYMPNQMMHMPDQNMDSINQLEAKVNRLERQVKRLDQRVSNLENANIMPLSSKSKGYDHYDNGMYMM